MFQLFDWLLVPLGLFAVSAWVVWLSVRWQASRHHPPSPPSPALAPGHLWASLLARPREQELPLRSRHHRRQTIKALVWLLMALAFSLIVAMIGRGQSIDVPAKVEVESGPLVVIKASAFDADDLRWYPLSSGIQPLPSEAITIKPGFFLGVVPGPGTYKLGVVPAKCVNGKAVIGQAKTILVVVGGQPPLPPVPPTPPGPTPPTPTPAPIPAAGLNVLIVYESAELSKLPAAQWLVLFSQPFRDWLDSTCKDWRIYDKDVSTANESKTWQDAMKLPRQQTPWLIISNPAKGGYQGPLPGTVDETKALIAKYAG